MPTAATKLKTLPDYLRPGLDLVFVGINPSVYSVERGHYYARANNQFWTLLSDSGLVPQPVTPDDDRRLMEWRIGLTDIVKRPTPKEIDLTAEDFAQGSARLRRKLDQYQPRIACFNGKGIYEKFTGGKCELGLQDEPLGSTRFYVMPSTSALNPIKRADKLRYFQELARLLGRGRSVRP